MKNHNLSGLLANDSNKMDIDSINWSYDYMNSLKELAKIPSSADIDKLKEASTQHNVNPIKMYSGGSGGLGIPMKDKENILRRELRAKKSTPDKIIASLGKDYFTNELQIPEDKISHFLTFCNFKNIFSLYNEDRIIELLTVLQEESIEYLKIEE